MPAAGKQYYFDAAEKLEKRLDRFGVDHDIARVTLPDDWDWADICKFKIRFFRDMLVEHQRPMAWIDVDTDVLRRPDDLLRSTGDFTCYLRAVRYLLTFDPEQLPRPFVSQGGHGGEGLGRCGLLLQEGVRAGPG